MHKLTEIKTRKVETTEQESSRAETNGERRRGRISLWFIRHELTGCFVPFPAGGGQSTINQSAD